jgi:RNA polymerase sigma-70 factor (ECF subfamily)
MKKLHFEEVYTTFEKPVYNYVLRMVKDAQLASDLVQEIFIKIYKNLESYKGNAKLSTWIYKIATNTYLDHFRTAVHKKDKVTEPLNDNLDEKKKLEDVSRVLSIDEKA